eukprot:114420-Amphidinium_carterae.3
MMTDAPGPVSDQASTSSSLASWAMPDPLGEGHRLVQQQEVMFPHHPYHCLGYQMTWKQCRCLRQIQMRLVTLCPRPNSTRQAHE